MRKLRKAERAVVDAAVDASLAKAMPALHQVEGIIAKDLIPNVPEELLPFAIRDFMNRLGNELFMEAELTQFLGSA